MKSSNGKIIFVLFVSGFVSLVFPAATAGRTGGSCRKWCCQSATAGAAGFDGELCLWWHD